MVVYSDLFLLTFVPIITQGLAGFYLLKIHSIIGRDMTLLWGAKNGALFLGDCIITYGIFLAAQNQQTQPLEILGFSIGFSIPITVGILSLALQYKLAQTMRPHHQPQVS